MALWCEEEGLKAESVAHLWSTLCLDRTREAAWKRLGYKKHKNGRWLTDAQLAQEKEEAELQRQADQHWKPLLEKWRSLLAKKDPALRAEAEKELAGVTDPRAVPMVGAVFASGHEASQKVAVQVLGQIDAAAASRALATLAVFSPSAEVRRNATQTLVRRDVREYGGLLIALVRSPVKYEVRHVKGPGSQGELFIQGKKSNLKRLYSPPMRPTPPSHRVAVWCTTPAAFPSSSMTRGFSRRAASRFRRCLPGNRSSGADTFLRAGRPIPSLRVASISPPPRRMPSRRARPERP